MLDSKIDDIQIANQQPNKYILQDIPQKVPNETPIIKYAIKFANITNFVFFNPLKIPAKVACNPSDNWKIATIYIIGTIIFIIFVSDVKIETNILGNIAKMELATNINIKIVPKPFLIYVIISV